VARGGRAAAAGSVRGALRPLPPVLLRARLRGAFHTDMTWAFSPTYTAPNCRCLTTAAANSKSLQRAASWLAQLSWARLLCSAAVASLPAALTQFASHSLALRCHFRCMLEENQIASSFLTSLHRPAGDCPHQLRPPAGGVFSGAAAATAIRTGRPARRPRNAAAAAAAGQQRQFGVGRRSGSEPAVRLRQQQPRQRRGRFGGEHQLQLRSGAERGAGAPGDRRRACGSRSGGEPSETPWADLQHSLLIQMALIVIASRMARTLSVHAIIAASTACCVLASQQSACGAHCRCRQGIVMHSVAAASLEHILHSAGVCAVHALPVGRSGRHGHRRRAPRSVPGERGVQSGPGAAAGRAGGGGPRRAALLRRGGPIAACVVFTAAMVEFQETGAPWGAEGLHSPRMIAWTLAKDISDMTRPASGSSSFVACVGRLSAEYGILIRAGAARGAGGAAGGGGAAR